MRIAIVTETFPPEINGVALTVNNFARGVVELGHRLQLVRPRQPESSPQQAPPWLELLVPGAPLPRYRGLRFGFPVRRRLLRAWQEFRPEAIYIATEGPLGWAAAGAARRLGIPAASGLHTRFDDFVGHYGFNWLRSTAFAYMRAFHNRANTTLVPTDQLRQFLSSKGFRNVQVLERAVDTRRFCPSRRDSQLRQQWCLRDDQLAVIHVGRLAPEKNLGVIEASFAAIQECVPDARMIWVGDGPSRSELAKRHPQHIFCGMRTGDDLARHFASGDLFLFSSLTETFGNVTLEAMASGLAVLAYDYAAAARHIRSGINGTLVGLDDAPGFVAAAEDLASDSQQLARIRLAARESVEALSPAAVAERFVEQLARLHTKPGPS